MPVGFVKIVNRIKIPAKNMAINETCLLWIIDKKYKEIQVRLMYSDSQRI